MRDIRERYQTRRSKSRNPKKAKVLHYFHYCRDLERPREEEKRTRKELHVSFENRVGREINTMGGNCNRKKNLRERRKGCGVPDKVTRNGYKMLYPGFVTVQWTCTGKDGEEDDPGMG